MRLILTFVFLLTMLLTAVAQQPATSSLASAQSTAASKDQVCDGGIELIPSGQMSFVRKRYVPPAKPAPKNARPKAKR